MTRMPVLFLALLCGACATPDGPREPERKSSRSSDSGPLQAARGFVDALNRLDTRRAAALIDWDTWVADDARLVFLLDELRPRATKNPPTPQALDSSPIEGSKTTLREILTTSDAPKLMASIAEQRFAAAIREDFAADRRTMDARLVSWHFDRIERSATMWLPNGKQIQMVLYRRGGTWKLVPRWHP